MSLVDYAIQRFDLVGYLQDHGAEPLRGSVEWVLPCPICGKDKLTVNVGKRAWHCWVCQQFQASGDGRWEAVRGAGGLLDLIQVLDHVDRRTAVDVVLSAAFMRPGELATVPQGDMVMALAECYQPAAQIQPPEGWRPIDGILPYMMRRGITLDDVRAFGLFWCETGRYANRLVFPVWEDGRMVYFQARAMWDPPPGTKGFRKALNPPATEDAAVSTQVLMNLDQARQYPRVAVTEGPMDCLRAGVDAVCTFGKTISGTQIAKLCRAGVQAIDLMWDADARAEMMHWASVLSGLFDVRLVFLPAGDPADYSREQLWAMRSMSQRLDDVKLFRV